MTEIKATDSEVEEAEDYRIDMGLSASELSKELGFSSASGYSAVRPMGLRTYLAVKWVHAEWLKANQKHIDPKEKATEYHLLVIQGSEASIKPIAKETIKVIDSLSSIFR